MCLVASGEASGTCTALPGDGAACLQPGSLVLTCQEDLACDTATDTCVRRVDNGEACTSEAQCLHACDGGTCTAPGC